jgi:hypothetical protein
MPSALPPRPRDGILRVEIVRDAADGYSLKDSYEKEKKLHQEPILGNCFFGRKVLAQFWISFF